jgi:hypothetical protein
MSVRKAVVLGLKVIILAIALTLSFTIGTFVSGMAQATSGSGAATASAAPQANPNTVVMLLFASSLFQAIVITYLVLQAQWRGWKVVGALFLVLVNTWVQSAIESAVFLRGRVTFHFDIQMPIMGIVMGVLFAPFAVWVLGGFRRATAASPRTGRARWSPGEWAGKLASVAVIFVAIYYLCGYYIAWQNPALRQFYAGTTELKSFAGQLASTWSTVPWMFPYQAGRGLLWLGLTLPAVWMLRGGRARVAFGVALMYAVLDGSAMLILPNPLMPPTVAHTHMVELIVSGLIFGAFVGWAMTRREAAAPGEAQVSKAA